MNTLSLGATTIIIPEGAKACASGYIASTPQISLQVPFQPVRYYRHGWQSWTLAAWVEPTRHLPPLKPRVLNPMQTDPKYADDPRPNGSWLGAVEAPDGNVLLLGALSLETHTALDKGCLTGWSEEGRAEWFIAAGNELQVFHDYAQLLKERFGQGRASLSPRIWCSWYSLYREISEERVLKILKDLEDFPFDVIQVDDGWQRGIGDWEANQKFPAGMAALAERIRASGRSAGLWLAPLLALPSTEVHRQHPEWLLHDEQGRFVQAGYNWGEPMHALDTTHPGALEWLENLMRKIRSWGYDYIKLDFLYAGALPGKRYNGMPREAAFRYGLQVIREALGEAYFLACGAPILPCVGLCDGLRVGADVAEDWETYLEIQILDNYAVPSARNAIRNSVNRLWLAPLLHTDPDIAYFRTYNNALTTEQMRLLQDLAQITGVKATSDLPAWLSAEERTGLAAFLQSHPQTERLARARFKLDGREVDFRPALELPRPKTIWEQAASSLLGALSNLPGYLQLNDLRWKMTVERAMKGK